MYDVTLKHAIVTLLIVTPYMTKQKEKINSSLQQKFTGVNRHFIFLAASDKY